MSLRKRSPATVKLVKTALFETLSKLFKSWSQEIAFVVTMVKYCNLFNEKSCVPASAFCFHCDDGAFYFIICCLK